MRQSWLGPFQQVLDQFILAGKIIRIGYCQDCREVRDGFMLVEDSIVCPVSDKHKHIPHTLYVTTEEKEVCCRKLAEKYTRQRGFFG